LGIGGGRLEVREGYGWTDLVHVGYSREFIDLVRDRDEM
jgi:hypothetical protein